MTMKWTVQFWLFFICTVCILYKCYAHLQNPYETLGVKKAATSQEIRRAYKQLAKEWHPDKTNDPEAQNRFVEIKQAYELLSDPDRRKKYDKHGITEDIPYQKQDYSRFHTNPFEDLFNHPHFNFQENDITFLHRLSITTRQYDKIIVPKSARIPYLIFFYTDWCFPCLQIAPYCRKLIDYLEPLNVEFVTVHSGQEGNLARRLNIHSLPCLVILIDGNVYVYKDNLTSIQKIIEFIRGRMPYKLVPKLQDNDVDDFLNGWEDNRVRGLIFEPRQNVRLRYLIAAYHFRDRVVFGFADDPKIRSKYQISPEMDTVLLFNENTTTPIASISMKDIPSQTLHHVISTNQYLALPRLSSQTILDALCPCEWNKPRKRLCVVLVTEASSDHDPHRESFRHYAQSAPYSNERVRFAYIYHEKQTDFVNSLIADGEIQEPILRVVIIWRRDTSHVKYEWLPRKWETEENLNDTVDVLENTISRLLRSSEALSYEAFVKDLFDEHAKGIFGRILTKVLVFSESIYDGCTKDQILPVLSIIGTLIFIVAVGYLMAYFVRIEEESIEKQKAQAGNNNNTSTTASFQPELRLHELRGETYLGLVRLLKPGCRTIILVLDMQSRQHLIPSFHKAVWPYRKNKTLMFAFMYIERGLSWYKELLQLSLPEERDLNINPRNCVGTVLSLNGHRKYFCMFHAKHPEKKKRKKVNDKKPKKEKDCEAAAFIGFDSDSTESDEDILLEGNLMDGFSNWLDRLFEGTTQRYYINYWPEFPNK